MPGDWSRLGAFIIRTAADVLATIDMTPGERKTAFRIFQNKQDNDYSSPCPSGWGFFFVHNSSQYVSGCHNRRSSVKWHN